MGAAGVIVPLVESAPSRPGPPSPRRCIRRRAAAPPAGHGRCSISPAMPGREPPDLAFGDDRDGERPEERRRDCRGAGCRRDLHRPRRSVAVPGDIPRSGPKHEPAMQVILGACRKAGKPCGLFTPSDHRRRAPAQGFQWVVLGNDQDSCCRPSRPRRCFAGGRTHSSTAPSPGHRHQPWHRPGDREGSARGGCGEDLLRRPGSEEGRQAGRQGRLSKVVRPSPSTSPRPDQRPRPRPAAT